MSIPEEVEIPELEGWMTATDAGDLLHLSRQSINKLVRAGRFAGARKLGKQYVLPIAEVQGVKEAREALSAEKEEELLEG